MIFDLGKTDLVQNQGVLLKERDNEIEIMNMNISQFQGVKKKVFKENELYYAISHQLQNLLGIQEQKKLNPIFDDFKQKIPTEIFKTNVNCSEIKYLQFERIENQHTVISNIEYLEFEGIKYHKKDKIIPKSSYGITISQFPINNLNNVESFSEIHFLEDVHIPNYFNFYYFYLINESSFQEHLINSSIKLAKDIKIGYVESQVDYLPGYNFYIQTNQHLWLLSTILPSTCVRWVDSLQRAIQQIKNLQRFNLQFGFRQSKLIMQNCIAFDTKNFFKPSFNLLQISDKETFSSEEFSQQYYFLKKFIKIFKYTKNLSKFAQKMIQEFHGQISNKLIKKVMSTSPEVINQNNQILIKYHYFLQKYYLMDVYLDEFIIGYNNQMFQQVIYQITQEIQNFLENYISGKDKRDLWRILLKLIVHDNLNTYKIKVNSKIFVKLLQLSVDALEKSIVLDESINLDIFVEIFISTYQFNDSFINFLKKDCHQVINSNFLESLLESEFYQEIENLQRTTVNEIEKYLERKIQIFFINTFFDLKFEKLFNQDFKTSIYQIQEKIPQQIKELIFNNILKFVLEYYFMEIFKVLSSPQSLNRITTKIHRDREMIQNFFFPLIEEDNLNILMGVFDQLRCLIYKQDINFLIQNLIKFNLFFANRLTVEILIAILMRNFNLPFTKEEQILNYFNTCVKLSESKCVLSSKSIYSLEIKKSHILYNSSKQPKNLANFLPHLTLNQIMKLKKRVLYYKVNQLISQKSKTSSLVQNSMSLVNANTCEKHLQNIVKSMIINKNINLKRIIQQRMDSHDYLKLRCQVDEQSISYYEMDSINSFYSIPLKQISSISKLGDLFITFEYLSKTHIIVLPTLLERNLWYFSIKNLKKYQSQITQELKEIKVDYFKVDLQTNQQQIALQIPIQSDSIGNQFNLNLFYSLKEVHKFISIQNSRNFHKTRSKSIDIMDLDDHLDCADMAMHQSLRDITGVDQISQVIQQFKI